MDKALAIEARNQVNMIKAMSWKTTSTGMYWELLDESLKMIETLTEQYKSYRQQNNLRGLWLNDPIGDALMTGKDGVQIARNTADIVAWNKDHSHASADFWKALHQATKSLDKLVTLLS